jgi:hypothetical protein
MHYLSAIGDDSQTLRTKKHAKQATCSLTFVTLTHALPRLMNLLFNMAVVVERKTNERETIIMGTHTHMYKAENVE